jgi:membrane-bound metal-dependent hydrolase YbcI (DUF457 family)
MRVVTHFTLPIILAGFLNLWSLFKNRKLLIKIHFLLLIGICGALPDILSPHLSLQARYSSWSHNLWFIIASVFLGFIILRRLPDRFHPVVYLGCLGIILHILCDMISGGINWFNPYGEPVGKYYVHWRLWRILDWATVSTLCSYR